jgi:ABC-2 type transport system ATP-binding protein
MNDDIAIKVEGVSKSFKLPHEKSSSIKGRVVNFAKRNKGYEVQEALKDISFEVKKGEFFGIVGRNGSGKSTLLKLISGIYAPDKGNITVNGKLTPFIELGVGFNAELTGRENVFLNGALLGFSRKQMSKMYDEIVEFAELERFMDQKLKNYSSGMQVRLAFSIAIRAQSDILLIDEVLAVGDAAFQQKCYGIFSELKKQKKTIILITHDMSAVLRFCDRALLIENGDIKLEGTPKEVADYYLELNYDSMAEGGNPLKSKSDGSSRGVGVSSVMIHNNEKKTDHFTSGDNADISIEFVNTKRIPIHFGVQIFNEAGNYCFGTNTRICDIKPLTASNGTVRLSIKLDFVPGNYTITVAAMDQEATNVVVYRPNIASFRIIKDSEIEGIANLSHSWKV